jgi:type VI secretion system protein ImpH
MSDTAPDGPLASLVAGAEGSDFFQAVRLLDATVPGAIDLSADRATDALRVSVRPHDGLAFPAADVRRADWIAGDRPELRLVVTFMGLYGVDSPLPSYFGAAAGDEEAQALRDFLDIFNHRLYLLLFRSWAKYHGALGGASAAAAHERRLARLAGLGAPDPERTLPVHRLLPFAASLRDRVRNSEGLRRLIEGLLPGVEVRIAEHIPRWVTIADRPRVGRRDTTAALGDTALLGQRLLDVSGKFRIVLGPLSWTQFEALHSGGRDARALAEIVALYAPDRLDYDVELRISTAELPITRLGCPSNHLGLTTWAGRPPETIVSEIVEYTEAAPSAARREPAAA